MLWIKYLALITGHDGLTLQYGWAPLAYYEDDPYDYLTLAPNESIMMVLE